MSDAIIQVDNLSKHYRLGVIGGKRLVDDISRHWAKLRGKPDPLSKIGASSNDKDKSGPDEIWALKDVSFEVNQGEVLGIIGRNGAGKSTLLKVLSRVTAPTHGEIRVKGRIASLLEVGTGFHPELTGRENTFLNGAILGMTKAEIRSKFDEIVEFAEVGKFIDTPVKRYSSGMYVRLAFAVAAHLEPEILIVDEVLAVGDAEFQKKCLGKMGDVASQGRTVLFVSHNMAAVKSLCQRAIVLKNGLLNFEADANTAVDFYMQSGTEPLSVCDWSDGNRPQNENIEVRKASVYAKGKQAGEPIASSNDVVFEVEFFNNINKGQIDVTWDLINAQGIHVAHVGSSCSQNGLPQGWFRTTALLPRNILNTGRYSFCVQFGRNQRELLLRIEDVLTFDIEDGIDRKGGMFKQLPGVIHPVCDWRTEELK